MPSITLYSPNPTHQTLHESCSNTVYTTKMAPQNAPYKYKNFEIKTFSLSLHLPLQEKREKRAESSFPSTIEHTAPETISTPSERAVARVYTCIACRSAHPRSDCVCLYMSVASSLSLGERERERNPHTHTRTQHTSRFNAFHTHSNTIYTTTAPSHRHTQGETCLTGKTNLPVDIRAESQKIAVWVKIGTALPCTTPRPAPKSSTDDLACDLWEERRRSRLKPRRHTLWLG